MRCPKCGSKVFLRISTLAECVNCGRKLEELEGWSREPRASFI